MTYPIHDCQRNAHVKSAVSKVYSLWAVYENAIVKRLHPVSVTALQLKKWYSVKVSISSLFTFFGSELRAYYQTQEITVASYIPDNSPQQACTPLILK